MDSKMSDVSQKIENQLSGFENNIKEASNRIKRIERFLYSRVTYARKLVLIMSRNGNPMMLSQIIDILEDIERVSSKLTSIDITPSGYRETSLESLTEQEHDEMETLIA